MRRIHRREFVSIVCAGLASAWSLTYEARSVSAAVAPTALRTDPDRVFDLSIASGDPTLSGVVLWTHIRRAAFDPSLRLFFQVSTESSFGTLYLEGEVASHTLGSSSDYTVRVDLDGRLEAGRVYYYRFIYGDTVSRVGRCRTLPTGAITSLKFAILSCQDFGNGYYGALRFIGEDDSIDYVLHLGDFIYETTGDPAFQDEPFADRHIVMPSGGRVALGLDDYRALYASYRSDRALQLAIERHTWIMTHDDHETADNAYWDYARDCLGAPNHPYTTDPQYGNDPGLLRGLKLASQRAWSEYTPTRIGVDPAARHPHQYSRVYRRFSFGDLVDLNVLDTRTYRTPHPCGEGRVLEQYLPIGCNNTMNPAQTILGAEQRNWLLGNLTSSRATWKVLGNQTFLSPLRVRAGVSVPINVDAWDGYEAERRALLSVVRDHGVKNFVVLTGDMHTHIASAVKYDYRNVNPFDTRNLLGVEFMTSSVTSTNLFDHIRRSAPARVQPILSNLTEPAVWLNNPHIKYFDSMHHGYSTIEFTRGACEWVAYSVNKDALADLAQRRAVARFRKLTSWPWLSELSA